MPPNPKTPALLPRTQAPLASTKPVIRCPYCQGKDIIRKGTRTKKHERVQLHFCRRCRRKFTPLLTKHYTYPLKVILDALTLYNRFHSLEDTARILSSTYGLQVGAPTIARWTAEFSAYAPMLRLRSRLIASYDTRKALIEARLLHGQVYDFAGHLAKLDHLTSAYQAHRAFAPLKEFLQSVPKNCPHQLFRESAKRKSRSSQAKAAFSLDQATITPKPDSSACKTARLVLQAVANNKLRHASLQRFLLANDSVTVAVEVPVILTHQDAAHFQNSLGFQLPLEIKPQEPITGHIDILQVRNGCVHILDYKPKAKQQKPIEQLTIYALALSRLTGIRLFDFKCAWFDESDYYEFYPLHVVHKR